MAGTPTRRLQSQVLFLIGMLVLVLLLVREAGKPQRWNWLWAFQTVDATTADQQREGKLDTRVRPSNDRGTSATPLVLHGLPVATKTERPRPHPVPPADGTRQTSLAEVWSPVLETIAADDQACFLRLLKATRDGQASQPADRQRWPQVLVQLEQGWKQSTSQPVSDADSQTPPATQESGLDKRPSSQQLQRHWIERLQPALLVIDQSGSLSSAHRQTLTELQAILDTVFLGQIRDNTVFTHGEQNAWFRLLETLQATDLATLEQDSCGPVGFAQLYREPQAYRGRLVTVRGTVRLGYYRSAPVNIYGITGYYQLWLRPVGSTNPIVVYALALPPDFPDVRAIESAGRKPELHEDVEVTGYFFKRWAYGAEDGTRLAPLILAKLPRWDRSAIASGAESQGRPRPLLLLLGVAGAAILAAAFVALATRWTPQRGALRPGLPATDGEVQRELAKLTKPE